MSLIGPGSSLAAAAVDGAGTATINDVIGARTDGHNTTTLAGQLHKLDEHFHMSAMVIPTLADGVVVTATSNDWTDLGAFAVVAATNAITSDFDIHFVNVEAVSANGIYELVLFAGADAAEVEIGRVRFGKTTNQDGPTSAPIITPLIPANTQIKAKLASDNAVADTVAISLEYHIY